MIEQQDLSLPKAMLMRQSERYRVLMMNKKRKMGRDEWVKIKRNESVYKSPDRKENRKYCGGNIRGSEATRDYGRTRILYELHSGAARSSLLRVN